LAAVPPAKAALTIVKKSAYNIDESAARNERAVEAIGLDILVHNMNVSKGPNGCICARQEGEH
jgi:hypothetical protein